MLRSAARGGGDLAGVFEYDSGTGWFYLYATGSDDPRILEAIHIVSGPPGFPESEVSVRWDADEQKVGLFLRGVLWAVFGANGARYGGDFEDGAESDLPTEATEGF